MDSNVINIDKSKANKTIKKMQRHRLIAEIFNTLHEIFDKSDSYVDYKTRSRILDLIEQELKK